ncbi:PilN domain-containing protein [Geomonas sp. Red32]|uniref:PilN domain-containing protein n=1 Tax=Geomonas sp. Red32 TaxID=2912856 RepID=UPI00202CC044|nr:PilN domain-containing protein [Geomonas sp. Red32]MCM0083685.1 PilN domain-containing protein [Geomonas sp. Red32]
MIRINLLPVRASKKKETIRQQISLLIISMVGVLLVGMMMYFIMLGKVNVAKNRIEAADAELKSLKAKIGAIDNLKKLQADVKKKLDVLAQLRRGKTGPSSRWAALSAAVPDQLWVTKYTESGTAVALGGYAMSEELIAQFMRNLQASGSFANVELQVSEQADQGGLKAKRFDLTFQIKDKPDQVPPGQPGKPAPVPPAGKP